MHLPAETTRRTTSAGSLQGHARLRSRNVGVTLTKRWGEAREHVDHVVNVKDSFLTWFYSMLTAKPTKEEDSYITQRVRRSESTVCHLTKSSCHA